jgi:CRISPR-associated endonuclease/helicase Cas3
LLDQTEGGLPATLDGDLAPTMREEDAGTKRLWSDERLSRSGLGFRVRTARRADTEVDWRVVYRRFLDANAAETEDPGTKLEWRVEEWVGDGAAENESSLAKSAQLLDTHHSRIVEEAGRIATNLQLPDDERDMLVTAARYHDCGKARAIWQRFAGNPGFARDPGKHPPLAKFATRGDPRLLHVGGATYRHELGSAHDAVEGKAFDHLSPQLRMLGLRLIAAHHGHARPGIFAYDERRSGDSSTELVLRLVEDFTALQAQWGPWGLAWWESLLRAADVAASREHEPQERR